MAWIPEDCIEFFRELELNNNREWFLANKKRYEKSVKAPMETFAARMIERMKEIDPTISMLPKDALFRIYRDTRFSKDKTPYKDHAGMSISSEGRTAFSKPGLYFHLGTKTMGIASGCYHLEPEQLKKMRQHLVANKDEFAKQLKDMQFVAKFGEIKGEKNKILPPEFKEAALEQPLIYNKQFYYWAEHDVETALRDDLDDFIIEHIRAAEPMNTFLMRAFG